MADVGERREEGGGGRERGGEGGGEGGGGEGGGGRFEDFADKLVQLTKRAEEHRG